MSKFFAALGALLIAFGLAKLGLAWLQYRKSQAKRQRQSPKN